MNSPLDATAAPARAGTTPKGSPMPDRNATLNFSDGKPPVTFPTLSGTIGALLARGMEPFTAVCAGVHAHQRAGRIAAERVGAPESLVATDVIAALPSALIA